MHSSDLIRFSRGITLIPAITWNWTQRYI